MKLAEIIAQYVYETDIQKIPKAVVNKGKQCLLDTIGVSIFGQCFRASKIALNLALDMGGKEQSLILGSPNYTNAYWAAFVNGISAHVADFDDSSVDFKGHPSSVLMPAALAAAEIKNVSGIKLLEGFILGNEVGSKLGQVMGWNHYNIGWHGTGTVGTIAASVAAASILDLKPEQIIRTIGIAASSAAGIRQNFGTMTKSFHAGQAAAAGLMAALLAEKGFDASKTALEGDVGFIKVFNGSDTISFLREKLGDNYSIKNLAFKKYPSCAGTHAAVDAALFLKKKYRIEYWQIDAVECAARPNIESILIYNRPQTGLEAKFSMQYCTACALINGKLGIQDFEDTAVQESEVQEFVKKIRFISDPEFEKVAIERNLLAPTRVKIFLKDGQKLEQTVLEADGGPLAPLSWGDLEKKYLECATTVFSPVQAEYVKKTIMDIENLAKIKDLTDQMVVHRKIDQGG